MGIIVNRNRSFTPTLEDLSCKGYRALYAITSKIPLKGIPIKTMIEFDTCIATMLLYESGVWAPHINNTWLHQVGFHSYWQNTLETCHYLHQQPLTRNINYIKYLNNKCNSTLVKQALDYETSKKYNSQTLLSLVQKLYIANNEDIWTISKYKLSKPYVEFNRLLQDQIPLYPKAATYLKID